MDALFLSGVLPTTTDRAVLLSRARENVGTVIEPLAAFPDVMQAQFVISGDEGEPYRASLLSIPGDTGNFTAIILREETPLRRSGLPSAACFYF